MGFWGVKNWVESDNAADFRSYLMDLAVEAGKDQTKLKQLIRKAVDAELKDNGNDYNTPGIVNVALCMKSEGEGYNETLGDLGLPVFSHLLTLTQLKKIERELTKEIPRWNPDLKDDLTTLKKVVGTVIKARKKTNK